MFLKKVVEMDAFQREEQGILHGSDRSGSGHTIDDRHLAEKVPGAQNRKRSLPGLRQVFNNFHGAGTDNEHSIAGFAFSDDDVALFKCRFFDDSCYFAQCGGVEPGKDRDGLQKSLTGSERVCANGSSVFHGEIVNGPMRLSILVQLLMPDICFGLPQSGVGG